MPLPLSPTIGFGMKVAVMPKESATLCTTYLSICTWSAFSTRVAAPVPISAWPPVPTSWWCISTSSPTRSRVRHMAERTSNRESTGGTGKYPPLSRTRWPRLPSHAESQAPSRDLIS